MVRVGISVEGTTEERFIQMVVAPFLLVKGIYIQPISMNGNVRLDRVRSELKRMAASFDYVTTFYDFYGFKGVDTNIEDKATLEKKILLCVHNSIRPRLIPYVQMYEFEGLLFSDPMIVGEQLSSKTHENVGEWARTVLAKFQNKPEEINSSFHTAPSKRLEANTNYRKTTHGPNIAKAIGVQGLRERCKGFDGWLKRIEYLVPTF